MSEIVGTYGGQPKTRDDLKRDYRKELIEVMAVALAAIQDHQSGAARIDVVEIERIFGEVIRERQRQNEKWGAQSNSRIQWVAILAEELGEVSQAAMRVEWAIVQEKDGET